MSAMPTMPVFTNSGGALIASPDSILREQVVHRLNGRCRPVQQALGGADALAKLEKGEWQVLFLDRRFLISMRKNLSPSSSGDSPELRS